MPSRAATSFSAPAMSKACARLSSTHGPAIRASGRSLPKRTLPMLTTAFGAVGCGFMAGDHEGQGGPGQPVRLGPWKPLQQSSEVVVHTRLYGAQAVDEVPIAEVTGGEQRVGDREIIALGAEVHEVVFELCRPMHGEGVFDAHAKGPAGAVIADARGKAGRERRQGDVRDGRTFVHPGPAAFDVDQRAVQIDAETAGDGGET